MIINVFRNFELSRKETTSTLCVFSCRTMCSIAEGFTSSHRSWRRNKMPLFLVFYCCFRVFSSPPLRWTPYEVRATKGHVISILTKTFHKSAFGLVWRFSNILLYLLPAYQLFLIWTQRYRINPLCHFNEFFNTGPHLWSWKNVINVLSSVLAEVRLTAVWCGRHKER